jgi:hypothetical protein
LQRELSHISVCKGFKKRIMRLDRRHEKTKSRALPHHELIPLKRH